MTSRSHQSFGILIDLGPKIKRWFECDVVCSNRWKTENNFLKTSLVELFTFFCGCISNIFVIIAPGENSQKKFPA